MIQGHYKNSCTTKTLTQFIIILSLTLLALKYRSELIELQSNYQQSQSMLEQFSTHLSALQNQQKQLSSFYQNNYSQVLNIVKTQLAILKNKLNTVTHMYSLHNQLYTPDQKLSVLTLTQRITRMENILKEETTTLRFVEEILKDKIKEDKFFKMDQAANDPYFGAESMRTNWKLLKANLRSPFTTKTEIKQFEQYYKKEEKRLEDSYQLSRYTEELPFCIIVPSYNNAKNFRYEFNLQSILNQDYQNYHVVIVDDASPDLTGLYIQRFLDQRNISKDKVTLIRNKKQMTAVPNIHYAITKHCKSNEIGFFVDGDDELVGVKAFKIFNALYQSKKPAIAYSVAFQYMTAENAVSDNWSQEYTLEQKQNNMYRDVPQKISHLRSFRIDLYLQIKQSDLKDEKGQWFTSTYDEVICLPMLEMSCGNILFIQEYLYLYIFGTGYNDLLVDGNLQHSIARKIKYSKSKYQCDPKFMHHPDS